MEHTDYGIPQVAYLKGITEILSTMLRQMILFGSVTGIGSPHSCTILKFYKLNKFIGSLNWAMVGS